MPKPTAIDEEIRGKAEELCDQAASLYEQAREKLYAASDLEIYAHDLDLRDFLRDLECETVDRAELMADRLAQFDFEED